MAKKFAASFSEATADIDQLISQSPGAVTAEIDGQLVALDDATGTCFGLNEVATHIWKLIETPISQRDICAALLQDYDVDEATCREQVRELVVELRDVGLVR